MTAPHPFTDAGRGRRLQKVLAEAGVASRRACETLIESDAVAVNGIPVTTLPAWVDPAQDRITVHGKRIKPPPQHVYIMLFKPKGIVCTNADPQGRRRAIDLINHPAARRGRLYPVGRLDMDSSGLLLLTNHGELAHRLTHPRFGVHKVYEVTVAGALNENDVEHLEAGLYLPNRRAGGAGTRTGATRLRLLKRDRQRTRLRVEIREGRNRQIRRMMAKLGHGVRKLRRIEFGPLRLKGLRPGEWRELTAGERAALQRVASGRHGGTKAGRKGLRD
ncbi:MAG: pseudouridine synthase [Planctomycetota bacterium]|jgi:pseudouridine synthase